MGDAYTARQIEAGAERGPFWHAMLAQYQISSVLEVGCNVGGNLRHIAPQLPIGHVWGCDVNERALGRLLARVGNVRALLAPVTRLPFSEARFDLVLTCGLLIHIASRELGIAIDELVRVSRRYVLVIEYFAPEETEVPYRADRPSLWKRPFGRIIADCHPELILVEEQFLVRPAFDNCTAWLWRKS